MVPKHRPLDTHLLLTVTPVATCPSAPGGKAPWYESWFNRDYLCTYAHRNLEDAQPQFDLLMKRVPLLPGAKVLDLGCGSGRYLSLFSKAGFSVTGQDLSLDLLEQAGFHCPGVPLVHGDMREIKGTFDLIGSFFTSFGYFDEDGNRAVFSAVSHALSPGGHFWLDLPGVDYLRAHFTPVTQRHTPDGTTVREERSLNGPRMEKAIHLTPPCGPPREYRESVRLYSYEEIRQMAEICGMTVRASFGNYHGDPFSSNSPRLVVHLTV